MEVRGTFRNLNLKAVLASGALAVSGGFIAACGSKEAPKAPAPYAACKGLDVTLLNESKHEVKATTEHVVANGAVYEGIHYTFGVLGQNNPKFVPAAKSKDGAIMYEFPANPTNQTDTITAVVEYSYPNSHGLVGSINTCQVNFTFTGFPPQTAPNISPGITFINS